MLLSLFTGSEMPITDAMGTETVVGPTQSVTDIKKVTVPRLDLYVVQGGAFSDKAKATEMQHSLMNQGYAAVLTEHTDPFFMFIGTALRKEEAQVLGQEYEEMGQDVYIKPYTIVKEEKVLDEKVAAYFQGTIDVFERLVSTSTKSEMTNDQDMLQEIQKKMERVTELSVHIKETEPYHAQAMALVDNLKKGTESLQSYVTKGLEKERWNMQQQLLHFIVAYEEVVRNL